MKTILKQMMIFGILMLPIFSFSSVEVYKNFLRGSAIRDSAALRVTHYWNPAAPWTSKNSTIRVRLYLAEDRNISHANGNYTVAYTLTLYAPGNARDQRVTQTVSHNSSGAYADIHLLEYEGWHSASLKITSVSPSLMPDDLILELGLHMEWCADDDQLASPQNARHAVLNDTRELMLTWDYLPGAESYDVEWLFIDNPTGRNDLPYDFRNATRINTGDNHYQLPLSYPKGNILYRVRGVGESCSRPGSIMNGEWSFGTERGNVLPPANNSPRHDFDGLEPSLNWQYTAAYAEDGKRKEAVSFFDGTLRRRQQVSVLKNHPDESAHNTAMVGETFYDYAGRPALQSIPAPTHSQGIRYYGGNNGFNEYGGKDSYEPDWRINNPSPFPSTAGSSRYYSPNNPYLADAGWVNAWAVPDGGAKYLYSRTRYLNDGTDRAHSVSQPGDAFRMGGGKETRYFYSIPLQQEIDRLFGNEAGYAQHYQKVLSIDADGVVHVSYYDMRERLVASGIAGGGENLLEVDGRPPAAAIGSIITFDSATRLYSIPIGVAVPTKYTFTYNMLPTFPLCDTCHGVSGCLDCDYRVIFKLWSAEEKRFVFEHDTVVRHASHAITEANRMLNPGNYQLIKSIAYDREFEEAGLSDFEARQSPCAQYDSVAAEPCHTVCEDLCMQEFGLDKPDYSHPAFAACVEECENPPVNYSSCDSYKAILMSDMSPGGQYFDNIKARCPGDTAEAVYHYADRNRVLNHINPYYLQHDAQLNAIKTSLQAGTYDALWDSMRSHWEPYYAEVMLPYHPEYYFYRVRCDCYNQSEIDAFETLMRNTGSYEEAVERGLLNPLNMAEFHDPEMRTDLDLGYLPYPPGVADPYFLPASTCGGNCCNSSLNELIKELGSSLYGYFKYEEHVTYPRYGSLWHFIWDPQNLASLPGRYPPPVEEAYRDFQHNVVMNTMAVMNFENVDGARWYLFRNLYMGIRERVISQFTCQCHDNIFEERYLEPFHFERGQFEWFMHIYPPDAVEGICPCYFKADRSCPSTMLTTRPAGYQIRYACNPVFRIDNRHMAEMQQWIVEENMAECLENCETYANEWMADLRDAMLAACPGLWDDSNGNPVRLALIRLCREGCQRNEDDKNFEIKQLIDLQEYVQTMASYGCDMAVYPPFPPVVYQAPDNLLDCGCDKFQSYLNSEGLTFWDDPGEIQELLRQDGMEMDARFWIDFCTGQRYDCLLKNDQNTYVWEHNNFPERFRCSNEGVDWESICEARNRLQAEQLNRTARANALLAMADERRDLLEKHCMRNARESLNISCSSEEFLYTLYYYDQAGNLVRTVPPKGAKVINNQNTLLAVATNRDNMVSYADADQAGFIRPPHAMATNYRYNTLNQVVESRVPDHDGSSEVFYDQLNRPVLSRDAKQAQNNRYSYTLYDALGRIVEAGQAQNNAPFTRGNIYEPSFRSYFMNGSYRTEITKTRYDVPLQGFLNQTNLRNRIAAVSFQYNHSADPYAYETATHYSYDIHGNVKRLVQNIPALRNHGREYVYMDYEYDLVSGNVNRVWFQKGERERFSHRYRYDAGNRLTHAYTSDNGRLWHCDARYFYYPHGPLARVELGEKQVQGLDYAYTLQGWLKAVNGHVNDVHSDIGRDGMFEDVNALFPRDLFSTSLYYFPKDYVPVRQPGQPFTLEPAGKWHPLYNGNIAALSAAANTEPLLKVFQYDKINRLKGMRTALLNSTMTGWEPPTDAFRSEYAYDFNGNILSLQRFNKDGHPMHDIAYAYSAARNRLLQIQGTGIPASRYTYDPVGNLLRDKNAAKEMKISWNSAGKVSGVGGVGGLHFDYSPTGQRQEKRTALGSTYYIHDATGNVMATYTLKNNLFKVEDLYIYGSGRLGVYRMDDAVTALPGDSVFTRPIGRRQYELTDHLGNVTVTLPDQKSVAAYSANYISYEAVYLSHTDYYPFGYPIAERSSSRNGYRYGFNGQEKDDEIYGDGASLSFEFRNYDSRLGRFWSIDPLYASQPGWSPYKAFLDNPILYSDPTGGREIPRTVFLLNNGTTVEILQPYTSNRIMTDGKKRMVENMGGGSWRYVNNYYDYYNTTTYTQNEDGTFSTGTTSYDLITDGPVRDRDNVWFGGNKGGDSKFDVEDWANDKRTGGSQGSGYHWVVTTGGADPTKTKTTKGDIPESINVDDLLGAIGAMGKNPKQRPMSKSPRGGDDLGSLINEIISTIQGGNPDNSGGLDPEEKIYVRVNVKYSDSSKGTVETVVLRKDSAKTAEEIKKVYKQK